jgi:hypothetical protein
MRTNDFAKKAFIHNAENFHRNDAEEIRRFIRAQFADETGEPFVADNERFGEARLEQVAVEKWNMRP